MRNSFITGVTTGAIIGTAIGMMAMPQVDRSTKRRMRKSGKVMKNMAEDMYDNMVKWMR